MKKLFLLSTLILSLNVMANNKTEIRAGVDLTRNLSSSNFEVNKDAIKRGVGINLEHVISSNYDNSLEYGVGIAYKYNELKVGYANNKGVHSVPIYGLIKYNFNNFDSTITPYVKANLGYSFNHGKSEAEDYELKIRSGLYYGLGAGFTYNDTFTVDLSYNWNTLRVRERETSVTSSTVTRTEVKDDVRHGALTLGVGYIFKY